MNFDVRCECGGHLLISEGAAGARITCDCGRTLLVPSLDDLRQQAGMRAPDPSPVLVIADMLAHGELPTVPTCACCDRSTSDIIIVTAECEKTVSTEPTLLKWIIAWWFLGVFAILLRQRDHPTYGRDLNVHLPVRLCQPCQRRFKSRLIGVGLGLIAVLTALIGVSQLASGVTLGWAILACSVLVGWAAFTARQRRRAALKNLLARERIYHALLQKNPDARLLFASRDAKMPVFKRPK
jgi:hypothetical protein